MARRGSEAARPRAASGLQDVVVSAWGPQLAYLPGPAHNEPALLNGPRRPALPIWDRQGWWADARVGIWAFFQRQGDEMGKVFLEEKNGYCIW